MIDRFTLTTAKKMASTVPVPTSTAAQSAAFPNLRMRRLRTHPRLREMVRETRLSPSDLILPLFVRHGENQRVPIASMPGHNQLTIDLLADEVSEIAALGIPAVILFGIPAVKDAVGSDACDDHGIVAEAVQRRLLYDPPREMHRRC